MKNNLAIYEEHGDEWWDSSSPYFRSLHGITHYRLAQLLGWTGDVNGLRVLDLGCGGGLMSRPLAERGAQIVGCDLSGASLRSLRRVSGDQVEAVQCDATSVPFQGAQFDLVLLADVLDHIPNYHEALRSAASLLVPGGLMYVNTLNRTIWSKLIAVVIGEGVGLVPKGTHDHRLFIKPEELSEHARQAGLEVLCLTGEVPALLKTVRHWAVHFRRSRSLAVAYSGLFRKRAPTERR